MALALEVKPFDVKYAKAWFVHLEAAFNLRGIVKDEVMYNFIATCLPLSILEGAVDFKEKHHPMADKNYYFL